MTRRDETYADTDRCSICGVSQKSLTALGQGRGLSTDYDEETNVARGLLCPKCSKKVRKYLTGEHQLTPPTVKGIEKYLKDFHDKEEAGYQRYLAYIKELKKRKGTW